MVLDRTISLFNLKLLETNEKNETASGVITHKIVVIGLVKLKKKKYVIEYYNSRREKKIKASIKIGILL